MMMKMKEIKKIRIRWHWPLSANSHNSLFIAVWSGIRIRRRRGESGMLIFCLSFRECHDRRRPEHCCCLVDLPLHQPAWSSSAAAAIQERGRGVDLIKRLRTKSNLEWTSVVTRFNCELIANNWRNLSIVNLLSCCSSAGFSPSCPA